jgi:2-polyprenyl-6-methoxyphenol hydroxylase-like FAD-dependent oxidoreductase
MMKTSNQQAIVIGASMGGLLAARALADYYQQVIVLERDIFPVPSSSRKGVPQSRHAHALLSRGREIIEQLFPGITEELKAQGALTTQPSQQSRWFINGGYLFQKSQSDSVQPYSPMGIKTEHENSEAGNSSRTALTPKSARFLSVRLSADAEVLPKGSRTLQADRILLLVSRPLLEAQVRKRLLSLPNIKVIENCDVLGLLTTSDSVQPYSPTGMKTALAKRGISLAGRSSCTALTSASARFLSLLKGSRTLQADHSKIVGVRLSNRADQSSESVLNADLVVDATGRRSVSPVWLEKLGYEKPPEEQVRMDLSYTTRSYRRRPEHLQGDLSTIISPSFPNWRGGVILAQEGDRWIVSMAGYLGDHAPTDEEGFLEFAKSMPTTEFYDVIKDAEPLSEILPYKVPTSQRRRYEKMARFPENYLVFGDAICSFNPVYGQGMTVSALESLALQNCLAKGSENLAKRFFKEAAKVVDIPWSIAVGSDLRIPQVEGTRSLKVRFLNWYISKLHVAAPRYPVLAIAFLKVTNLLASPYSLMHPRIALRVLLGNLLQVGIPKVFKYKRNSNGQIYSG